MNFPWGPVCAFEIEKRFGVTCSSSMECIFNLYCISGSCGCHDDLYYNSPSLSCFQKKRFGVTCSSSIECIFNLYCISGSCGCHDDLYHNSSSLSCFQKLDHGAECQSSLECKGFSRNCTSYHPSSTNKCLCASDFYLANNSLCISKNNLKITATAITRETRTVIFVWHGASQRSDVSYSIRWNGSNKIDAAETGVPITGLEPGTLYTFSILTSLPDDGNYPAITVEQPQSPLWTHPDRPGAVSEVHRVANSTYKITFGQSNGSVFQYAMSVSMGGSVIETQNSTSTEMNFTKLNPATTYIYVLESYNGNSENSDPTTGNFTTGPEAREEDASPVGAIVGGVLGGLALIAVIGVIVCLIRKAQSRREIRESIRENPETQVTGSDRHTPKQTSSEHIELPLLQENSNI